MKKVFSKTIKFSRFTISIFTNEIVTVFIGDKKIYIKSFRLKIPKLKLPWKRTPRFKSVRSREPRVDGIFNGNGYTRKKRTAFAISAALIAISFIFFLQPSKQKDAPGLDDEAEKKKLLESKQTDYSSPEKFQKLVIHEHKVVQGETLQKIARKYGVSVDTIRGTNNLAPEGILRIGSILKIPSKDGILHKMQKGGDLVSIARKYRVSLKKIIEENDVRNPDFVVANTVLFIPDAKPLNSFPGFIWPSGERFVTCGYGWRRNPFDPNQSEFHPGIDIRSNFQWVKASKYGKITYTGWLGGYGKTIVIAHPGGLKTLYAHLSRIIVRNGQYVKQGQLIAASGNSGRSTGAHLHFEILRDGKNINPYIYFRKKAVQ
jgi:murein DD-endopeptidase MepM/ murein hydrolase activator NlpD